jgi:hypothetical protein
LLRHQKIEELINSIRGFSLSKRLLDKNCLDFFNK